MPSPSVVIAQNSPMIETFGFTMERSTFTFIRLRRVWMSAQSSDFPLRSANASWISFFEASTASLVDPGTTS